MKRAFTVIKNETEFEAVQSLRIELIGRRYGLSLHF